MVIVRMIVLRMATITITIIIKMTVPMMTIIMIVLMITLMIVTVMMIRVIKKSIPKNSCCPPHRPKYVFRKTIILQSAVLRIGRGGDNPRVSLKPLTVQLTAKESGHEWRPSWTALQQVSCSVWQPEVILSVSFYYSFAIILLVFYLIFPVLPA